MERFVITPEMVKRANCYVDLLTKSAIAAQGAKQCVTTVHIQLENTAAPVPDRAQENVLVKARLMMGMLAAYYLKIPFEGQDDDLAMPLNIYDQWAASHVMNQLERMKSNAEVRDKVFDLLTDFKEWQKMLNTEIYALLKHRNDTCTRILEMMEKQSTPEAFQNAVGEIQRLQDEIQKIREKRIPDGK